MFTYSNTQIRLSQIIAYMNTICISKGLQRNSSLGNIYVFFFSMYLEREIYFKELPHTIVGLTFKSIGQVVRLEIQEEFVLSS